MNRPMMAYIVELLKKHGITEIGVTLQYMPENIRDYFGNGWDFGVNMRYYVEETPLGTAGSVKNAGPFLDDTFVVISGDALTDFDLAKAIAFHREKGSVATLVLTRVATPLEYGVVITDRQGAITQFLEKPSWGEVFSDTVNTGIYVLEPEVLGYLEEGRNYDFSKDLFPLLLEKGRPIHGVVLDGYWCDIGNLQQYLQAHMDALSGRVGLDFPWAGGKDNLYTGQNVEIDPAAVIKGPAFIGNNCKIGAGARIDSFTVLGDNCIVGERATIKRSITWNGAYIGSRAALRGAILGSRVQVLNGAGIYEGAVIGSDTIIRENGIIKPDVKVWPHKVIEAGATVQNSIVWGTRFPKKIFGLDGVTGLANIEMTPEFAARIAASFATVMGKSGRLAVSSDSYAASQMIKRAVISGMQSVGAMVAHLGDGITPMHRYTVRALELDGGIHVKVCARKADLVTMVFINGKGGNISRSVERKVENVMLREDFNRSDSHRIVPVENFPEAGMQYGRSLDRAVRGFRQGIRGLRLVMAYDRMNLDGFIKPAFASLGILHENIDFDLKGRAGSWQSYRELLPQLSEAVVSGGADGGAVLDHNGDSLILLDERGRVISEDLLTALSALIVFKTKGGPVVVPVTAPDTIDKMAEIYGGKVVRTKTAVQDFIDRVIAEEGGETGESNFSQFLLNFDALGALLSVMAFTRSRGLTLGQLADEIPAFYMNRKVVPVPWEAKGTVIRKLIEEPDREMELLDGVKVFHSDGWALVLPDPEEPICRIFSEGATMEIAESLADFYANKISSITGTN
jgi:mannose-1-phosphate guanylyltransferase/phosphomannomutase